MAFVHDQVRATSEMPLGGHPLLTQPSAPHPQRVTARGPLQADPAVPFTRSGCHLLPDRAPRSAQDTQLVRDALETLVNLTDLDTPKENPEASNKAGQHNSAVLLATPSHLGTALGAAEDTDMCAALCVPHAVPQPLQLALDCPSQEVMVAKQPC